MNELNKINELNEEEKEMLKRALMNQRDWHIEEIKEKAINLEKFNVARMSQDCDDIKLINGIFKKLNLTEENKKG